MYAVISDIHGNFEALEAVLRDMPGEVETVYCLGDVIGYGASPNECCDAVRELGMPTITGNHDLAVTDLSTDLNWFNPVAAAAVMWTREQLTEENAEFLRSRPRMMQTREALFVHGSVRDPDEYIINSISAEENLAVLTREYPNVPVCFYGHTHVKAVAPSPNGAMNGGHTLDLRSGGPYLVNPAPWASRATATRSPPTCWRTRGASSTASSSTTSRRLRPRSGRPASPRCSPTASPSAARKRNP
jgi:predicted phosphodiesterase